jgi:hypothetical protein
VSTEAITSLEEQIQVAQAIATQSGVVKLSVTETQITSLLAARLNEQTDPFIRNPQVYLRDGLIQVYGIVTQGNLEANARVTISVTIDAQGKPVFTVTSIDLGPIPAPTGLNDTISASIGELFTKSLGESANNIRFETINIADGVMTISGKVQ